jgi:outer membrane protein OmpA-like peptidoglycan-associated protein
VLIEGHCDSMGSTQYNYKLSERRANEVRKLLLHNGLNPKTIKTCIGYGKDQPLTNNLSEIDRQLNRRVIVHFTISEKDSRAEVKKENILKSEEFKVGKKITLKNLLFYGGRHILKPESKGILDNLCDILKKNPKLKIEIQGHVCCTTNQIDGYDYDTRTDNLSVNRAKAIYELLIQECGILENRLSYKGFGGRQKLIEDEITEEERSLNRRVEIKVLED